MRPIITLWAAFAAVLLVLLPNIAAAQQKPMLVEGTSTVYQRVLTKPGAVSYPDPQESSSGTPLAPLQPLYVYARQGQWVQYGRGIASGPEGWLPGDDAVEWKQNIVVAFANPAGRKRQLFFDSKESLMQLITSESPLPLAREYREAAAAGHPPAASGVVAIEPNDYVDITENFYLMPILDWAQELHPMTFQPMRLLDVASLPLHPSEQSADSDAAKNYKVGIVFVIDTTVTMGPYIEEVRAAVDDMLNQLRGSPVGQRIRFGVVGFRDDTIDAMVYTTKTFVPLSTQQTVAQVMEGLRRVNPADVSNIGFPEDSTAGIVAALDMPGWDSFGGRYVIVISDASPMRPDSPAAKYNLDAGAVRLRAQEAGIQLMAMHLLGPDGVANHHVAKVAYKAMTRIGSGGRSLYFPIEGADPSAFADKVRAIVDFLVSSTQSDVSDLRQRAEEAGAELSALQRASLAMRLRYLGRMRDAGAPSILQAWTLDSAIGDPLTAALDVRLLVTKNQLSTMYDVMAAILEAGETTQSTQMHRNFFNILRGAVTRMASDTETLVNTEFQTLGGAVGEFLKRLPYHSPLMNITAAEWQNMGPRRRAILDRLRARMTLYKQWHDDPSLWTALYEGSPPGEYVFAVPFAALP